MIASATVPADTVDAGGSCCDWRQGTATGATGTALSSLVNSHSVFGPHMAKLVMLTFGVRNCHWGRPNGTVRGLLLACRGFETNVVTIFLLSRLL